MTPSPGPDEQHAGPPPAPPRTGPAEEHAGAPLAPPGAEPGDEDARLPLATAVPIVCEHAMFVIWDALRRDAIDRLAVATADAHRLEQLLVITNTWTWQQDAAAAILADLQAAPAPEAAVSRDWMAAWLAQVPAREAYADQQDAVAARLGVQRSREIAQERVSPVFTAAKQRGRQILDDRHDARADHAQRRAPASAAGAVAEPTMADELGKLAALHAGGALTDEEFARAKARLLDA